MKKTMIVFLTLVLIASLSCTALAAETGLSLSNGEGQVGKTVYMIVKLNESVVGDSIGISYSYDGAILEAVPSSCSWSVQGVLQDFNNSHQGVWAAGEAKELKGNLCVLAFKIRSGAKFTSTTVSCTVAIQNGTAEVGSFTAEATVSLVCDHEYGEWKDQGTIGHSRECGLCGQKQTQSHNWDAGVVKENPDSALMDQKVFTCTVCGGTQAYEVPKGEGNAAETPETTVPPETMPTLPTAPNGNEPEESPQSTRPTSPDREENSTQPNGGQNGGNQNGSHDQESPYHDYNQPKETTDEVENGIISGDGHVHTGMEEEELPLIIQSNQSDESHDHDHEATVHTVTKQERRANLLLVFAVVGIMIATGAYFLKKKK